MSLGSSTHQSAMQAGIHDLWDAGVLLIAAAGNGGDTSKSYPASYEHVISVGATTSTDALASFSQRNDMVDVSAPGYHTLSTCGDDLCDKSGTSMATPHVTGVVAFVWNSHPDCTAAEIKTALEEGARDMGVAGRDDSFGHGIVSVWNSMDYLEANPCGSPTPAPTTPPPAPSPPPAVPECAAGCGVLLEITTDNYGAETSWAVHGPDGSEVTSVEAGHYGSGKENFHDFCVPAGQSEFKIFDQYGDGMCCGYGSGQYIVYMQSGEVKSGGEFGSSETTNL